MNNSNDFNQNDPSTTPIIDDVDVISLDDLEKEELTDSLENTGDLDIVDDGANGVGGHQVDLEIDDNVDDLAHSVGIGLNANEENPQELNIAQDVEDAERARREG